ncbi:hypothetical protein INR49_019775 [Caranx melampygus]|nr:hypothetical protein INR49_019775 [Caranx melampygus]
MQKSGPERRGNAVVRVQPGLQTPEDGVDTRRKTTPEPHANTSSFTREFDRHEPRMTQIVQELLKISTGKEVRTMNTKQKIFQTLEELRDEEFDKFRWYLCIATSIPRSHLDNANRCETVDRIVENYNQQSVEMVKNI